MPTLVLVTGLPGAGKTTLAVPLARATGLPLVGKDTIKEALHDVLPARSVEDSRTFSAAAYEVMFALATQWDAALLEANFDRERWGRRLLALDPRPLEIYCACPPELALERFARRPRGAPHFDAETLPELRARAAAAARPLGLGGAVLEVDTTQPVDIGPVTRWVRAHIERLRA